VHAERAGNQIVQQCDARRVQRTRDARGFDPPGQVGQRDRVVLDGPGAGDCDDGELRLAGTREEVARERFEVRPVVARDRVRRCCGHCAVKRREGQQGLGAADVCGENPAFARRPQLHAALPICVAM
jgi:hypothetical protein